MAADRPSPADPDGASRRLVVLESQESLGNAIWKIPFFRALRRAFPSHQIDHIVDRRTRHVDQLHRISTPYVDSVFEHAGIEKPYWRSARRLRSLPTYDVVFDTRSKVVAVVWSRLHLRHRRYMTVLPAGALSCGRVVKPTRPRHWVARLMMMVEAATGAHADWRGTIELPSPVRNRARAMLPQGRRYVGLAPGAAGPEKTWPLGRFVALARRIAGNGDVPVFLLGPCELAWAWRLRRSVPEAVIPWLDGDDAAALSDPVSMSLAVGECLSAAVTHCSGGAHLLANAQVPLVTLYGPTDPERFLPWTPHAIPVCAPDAGRSADLGAITIDSVEAALVRVMKAPPNPALATPSLADSPSALAILGE